MPPIPRKKVAPVINIPPKNKKNPAIEPSAVRNWKTSPVNPPNPFSRKSIISTI